MTICYRQITKYNKKLYNNVPGKVLTHQSAVTTSFLKTPLFFSLGFAVLIWLLWYRLTLPETGAIMQNNWRISLTMVFGSFIAGATSEGGGVVAFPVFTKLFHIPPIDAKIFSLAIQSIGMMSATLTIIVMRVKVEWRIIFWGSLGGVPGIFLGAAILTPLLPPDLVRMLFTVMLTSFAFTLGMLNWGHRHYNETLNRFACKENLTVLVTGVFGGIISGLVGNGIDIICFSVMILLFRLTEKVATPTSVVLMAFNSVIGFGLHLNYLGGFSPQVQNYWLAAVPVVVVGAPFGAYICTRLQNHTIAYILIALILVELISSLLIIPLSPMIISISAMVFLFFSLVYWLMSKITYYHA